MRHSQTVSMCHVTSAGVLPTKENHTRSVLRRRAGSPDSVLPPSGPPTNTPRVHHDTITRDGDTGVLPSYSARKPWALTAKSVVNHSVRTDPVLTTEEGSWNPDSLRVEEHMHVVRKPGFTAPPTGPRFPFPPRPPCLSDGIGRCRDPYARCCSVIKRVRAPEFGHF